MKKQLCLILLLGLFMSYTGPPAKASTATEINTCMPDIVKQLQPQVEVSANLNVMHVSVMELSETTVLAMDNAPPIQIAELTGITYSIKAKITNSPGLAPGKRLCNYYDCAGGLNLSLYSWRC